jgi:hypothetical protein
LPSRRWPTAALAAFSASRGKLSFSLPLLLSSGSPFFLLESLLSGMLVPRRISPYILLLSSLMELRQAVPAKKVRVPPSIVRQVDGKTPLTIDIAKPEG